MKAVVLNETGGPENLVIEEVATPEPAVGEVRVKLKTSALNRRDYWITIGKYPGVSCPSIGGSDGAGNLRIQEIHVKAHMKAALCCAHAV